MIICKHCSQPLIFKGDFCCLGCKTAYLFIHQLKLEDYYKLVDQPLGKPLTRVEIDFKKFIVKNNPMTQEIKLIIEGIRCGSCVWLIESALRQEEKILEATLINNHLKIVWEGSEEELETFIKIIEKLGYRALPLEKSLLEETRLKAEKSLLIKLSLAGFLWIQTMMISMGIWFGESEVGPASKILMNIFSGIITIPGIIYSSNDFFKSAWQALKARRSHMDIPISLAIIITLLISIYGTFIASSFVFYEAAASLSFALLVGRYFDKKIRNLSSKYAENFLLTRNPFITIFRQGTWQTISVKEAAIGEKFLVVSGERLALDGILLSEFALFDNSIITGESEGVKIHKGEKVFAGSINLGGTIEILIEKDEEHSLLSEIKNLVDKSHNQKSFYQDLAARLARIYTPLVLIISIITTIGWAFFTDFSQALLYGVSVLVITCPCALGLAVPLVHSLGVSNLMRRGIFIKSDQALEKLSQVDYVFLDKTGILTYGEAQPLNLETLPHEYLILLKSLAINSKHHLCQALVKALDGLLVENLTEIEERPGEGIKAKLGPLTLALGRGVWLGDEKQNEALTSLFLVKKTDKIIFSQELFFKDQNKPEGEDFINCLKKRFGYNISLISGDKKLRVEKLAKTLGIKNYFGDLKPLEKNNLIMEKEKAGYKVLMIGDGLNDAIALSSAFASVTPSKILEISQKQADLVFQKSLLDLIFALDLSKKVNNLAKENIIIASFYNIVSIPLAIMGCATPFMAALFMSLSSLFVLLNSLIKIKSEKT
jgi:Cu2+-exporting ATPase